MATILIKDLTESVDLDREAMTRILGGARSPYLQSFSVPASTSAARLVTYPAGFRSIALGEPGGRWLGRTSQK